MGNEKSGTGRWRMALGTLCVCAAGCYGSVLGPEVERGQVAASIAVSPDEARIPEPGQTLQLTVEVTDFNHSRIRNPTIAWHSSDEAVVTVDAQGLVAAQGVGTAKVFATCDGIADTVAIRVGDAFNCFADLPSPVLTLQSTEASVVRGIRFTRYRLGVSNRSEFPDELFDPAPTLAPCGLNNNSSRTWVEIYDGTGRRIYGFCALGSSDDLDLIWFSIAEGTPPPTSVYITLTDRQCGIVYTSNVLAL